MLDLSEINKRIVLYFQGLNSGGFQKMLALACALQFDKVMKAKVIELR